MTTQDVRDMLNLPQVGGDPSAPRPRERRPKPTVQRPDGITRELFALLGERAPPVAMLQEQQHYKKRPTRTQKAAKWELKGFHNEARSDGLVLRHWRKLGAAKAVNGEGQREGDGEDVDMEGQGEEKTEGNGEEEGPYKYAKFNVKIEAPKYTEEQYEKHLRNEGWSKEETDYLMGLVEDYALRWAIIIDRYDFVPSHIAHDVEPGAVMPISQQRTLEDLKKRYYEVCAKMMAVNTPLQEMSESEFKQHEMLMKWDPVREKNRRRLANDLLNRSPDEFADETQLLIEIQRICIQQEELDRERREVRQRLEFPTVPASQSTNSTQDRTSTALNQLMQQLLQADRLKKRRSLLAADQALNGMNGSSAANGHGTPTASAGPGQLNRSDSISTAAGTKKGSIAVPASTPTTAHPILSPAEEDRFAISTHERLTSGVSFRGDKLIKLRTAKSGAQTAKIQAALAELKVPDIIPVPTVEVCEQFERLVSKVNLLLDNRRVCEKLENEIRVLEAGKRERERRERGEDAEESKDGEGQTKEAEEDGVGDETEVTMQQDGEGEEEDGDQTAMDADADADADEDDADADADADDAEGDADADVQGEEDEDGEAENAEEEEEDTGFDGPEADAEVEMDDDDEDIAQPDEEDAVEQQDGEEDEEEQEEEQEDEPAQDEEEQEEQEEEAEEIPEPSPAQIAKHKRSASVLSAASRASQQSRSSKRLMNK